MENRTFEAVELRNGQEVLVTIVHDGASDVGPTDIADRTLKFEDAMSTVREVSESLVGSLIGLDLSSIKAEFGFNFSVKSGVLLAAFVEASAGATFKVTLEWAKP